MKTIVNRRHISVRILLSVLGLILLWSSLAKAQGTVPKPLPTPRPGEGIPADKSSSSDDRAPLTTFEEEMRAKRAIKIAEKEHQENLNRAREISQIGCELQDSLKHKSHLDRDANKKLDRLEKLTKKIRGEAGGEDEEVKIVNRPSDISSAVAQISETAQSLSKNVQDTPRQVVSATVIGNANVLLELIKIVRSFANQP
jgi:hypothetical protein